jgi:hypothetical protein
MDNSIYDAQRQLLGEVIIGFNGRNPGAELTSQRH